MTTCASKHTFKKKTPWIEILYYWTIVCILSEHNSEIHLVEGCKGFDIDNMDKSMIHSFVHQGILRENLGLLIVTMFCIFLVVTLHIRKSHCLPPGPWPWPIMGNLLMLGEYPHLALTHWAEKYGPLMHLQLGSINTLVASLPTMAKEILKTQDHVFQYRPFSIAFKILIENWNMGMISGLALQHIWKICTNELFTFKNI